jgi:hypothetical protein
LLRGHGISSAFCDARSRVLAFNFGAIPRVRWRIAWPPSAWDIGVNGMLLQKVIQRFRQFSNAIGLATLRRHTDIVHDHLTDALRAAGLVQQMIGKCHCENDRYAFMFGYRLDRMGIEGAHRDAIFQ